MNKILNGSTIEIKENQIVEITSNIKMPISVLTRWLLLIEALEVITDECNERNIEINEDIITKKVKPHKAITKYINERYYAALSDVILENNF